MKKRWPVSIDLTFLSLMILLSACDLSKSPSAKPASRTTPAAAAVAKKSGRPDLQLVLSEDQKNRSDAINAVLGAHGPLLMGEARDFANLESFLHLAATSEDEFVVSQSLQSMAALATKRGIAQGPGDAHGEAVEKARALVLYYLDEGSGAVGASACMLAQHYLGKSPDKDVLTRVIARLTAPEGSPYAAALAAEALQYTSETSIPVSAWQRISSLLNSPDTPPVALAHLLHLLLHQRTAAQRVSVPEHLLKSPAPIVRALSARAIASSRGRAAAPYLIALLNDDVAVVRAHAAWGLGDVGDGSAIDSLVALIQDEAETHIETLTGHDPSGYNVRYQLVMPIRSTVCIAAMIALEKLSDGKLRLAPFQPGKLPQAVAANRSQVRAWIETL